MVGQASICYSYREVVEFFVVVEAETAYKSPFERATIYLEQTARTYGEAIALHASCTRHGNGHRCDTPKGSAQFKEYQEAVLAYAQISRWLGPEAKVADLKDLSKEHKTQISVITDLYFSLGVVFPRSAEGKPSPTL